MSTAPSFADLGVPQSLIAQLHELGITDPFPIQTATLPDSLAGRDVLGRGRTGSGKTLAFALPVVRSLSTSTSTTRPNAPRALILVPTRELAKQVTDTLSPLARTAGLRCMTIVGGVSQGPQVSALARGVDICVATPGRLEDLIAQKRIRLDQVLITVLDEADHMADLGFLPAVKRLLDATPKGGQRLLFSATLDGGVDVLVRRYLHNPVTHEVDGADSAVPAMAHHLMLVRTADKSDVVRELVSGRGKSLAFTRTKHGAKRLARSLTTAGIPAVDLHGNLSQRERERNLDAFAGGRVRVLVATDIAARGIHVDDVGLVVHVDPPAEHKAYLHRSGRTARAGAEGTVVTIGTPDQRGDVKKMMRHANIDPQVHDASPGHPVIRRLAGPVAAHVAPAPAPTATAAAPSNGRGPRRQTSVRTNTGSRNSGGRGRRRSA